MFTSPRLLFSAIWIDMQKIVRTVLFTLTLMCSCAVKHLQLLSYLIPTCSVYIHAAVMQMLFQILNTGNFLLWVKMWQKGSQLVIQPRNLTSVINDVFTGICMIFFNQICFGTLQPVWFVAVDTWPARMSSVYIIDTTWPALLCTYTISWRHCIASASNMLYCIAPYMLSFCGIICTADIADGLAVLQSVSNCLAAAWINKPRVSFGEFCVLCKHIYFTAPKHHFISE